MYTVHQHTASLQIHALMFHHIPNFIIDENRTHYMYAVNRKFRIRPPSYVCVGALRTEKEINYYNKY